MQISKKVHHPLTNKAIDYSKTKESIFRHQLHDELKKLRKVALKKLVNQIILVAGDSDFVPASKLARREGIDFILDPMWNPINSDLHEHIDGLMSVAPRVLKYHATIMSSVSTGAPLPA